MVALHRDDTASRRPAARPLLRIVRPDVLPLVRPDALPDGADYRDTGCELSSSCLACPLARCKHDDPDAARALALGRRNREIALLHRKHGATVAMLARAYGITPRTVYRVLRRAREVGSET